MTTLHAIRPGPDAWLRMILTEGRLVARDTAGLIIPIGLPLLIMVMASLGLSDGTRAEPTAAFRGRTALEGYVVPMTLSMVVAVIGMVNMPSFLATYRRHGILRRLATTPASPVMVLIAQVVVSMVQTIVGVGLAVLVAGFAFDLRAPANLVLTFSAIVLTALAMYGVGVLVAAVSPTANSSVAIGLVVFFVTMALGGGFGGRAGLPETAADIGRHLPFGAGLDVISAAWVGAPLEVGQLIALAVTAALGTLVGVRLFRWQ